jgi:hypothetical protein
MVTTTAWIPSLTTANVVSGVATVDINETATLTIPSHGAAVVHIGVPTIDAANLTFNVVPYLGATARLLRDSAGNVVTYTASTGARSFLVEELSGVYSFTIILTAAQTSAARALEVACIGRAPIARLTFDSPTVESLAATSAATGTATITDASQTETTAWSLLSITPIAGAPLSNVRVVLDLAKAVTGFGVVETTASIQFAVARKVDGTNWRVGTFSTAVTGSNAALAGFQTAEIDVGPVHVTEGVRIYAKMSADATADIEIPYVVYYQGTTLPTIA